MLIFTMYLPPSFSFISLGPYLCLDVIESFPFSVYSTSTYSLTHYSLAFPLITLNRTTLSNFCSDLLVLLVYLNFWILVWDDYKYHNIQINYLFGELNLPTLFKDGIILRSESCLVLMALLCICIHRGANDDQYSLIVSLDFKKSSTFPGVMCYLH